AVWTSARLRGVAPERIAEWMSAAPARLAGLDRWKGKIEQGYDADITIWSPEASFIVDPDMLEHRHHVTPYAWRELYGVVVGTYVAGRPVYSP
ncbi:MAG TPA: amidohydrolase family protein, partial [Gemmatimonadaceae bacterium]